MNENELNDCLFKIGTLKHEILVLSETLDSLFKNHTKIVLLRLHLKRCCTQLNQPEGLPKKPKSDLHHIDKSRLEIQDKKVYFKTFPDRAYPYTV